MSEGMFDIKTCRDFHEKLKADFADFMEHIDSARLALNFVITAYHLHEWVWGDWLKTDYDAWKRLGIRDKGSFVGWLEHNWSDFKTIQDLTNGTKHFATVQGFGSSRIAGYGMGPYGIGPWGKSYLLLDFGKEAGDNRWQTAHDLIKSAMDFWNDFFDRYYLKPAPSENSGT